MVVIKSRQHYPLLLCKYLQQTLIPCLCQSVITFARAQILSSAGTKFSCFPLANTHRISPKVSVVFISSHAPGRALILLSIKINTFHPISTTSFSQTSLICQIGASLMAKMVKESACKAGDSGSVPGWGRSPGGGHGNPLQHSCLENPTDRGGWWGRKESDSAEWLTPSYFLPPRNVLICMWPSADLLRARYSVGTSIPQGDQAQVAYCLVPQFPFLLRMFLIPPLWVGAVFRAVVSLGASWDLTVSEWTSLYRIPTALEDGKGRRVFRNPEAGLIHSKYSREFF